jgi:hypothetical protein
MTRPIHYHQDDYPHTLAMINALVGRRRDAAELGYEPTEYGAFIDFDALTTGKLSTSERHVARAVQGLAGLERHGGGLPGRIAGPFRALVEGVCS